MSEVLDQQNQMRIVDSVAHSARMAYAAIAEDAGAPHVLMRPAVSIDGDMWCALYGENLQDGIAGFGKSPQEAMADFDKAWWTKLGPKP